MQAATKKRIGILRGGMGEGYTSSLKKGGEIISHITENLADKYKTIDILVDRDGVWHLNGVPVQPAEVMHKVDVVWNTADPRVSMILDNFSIPNIGTSSFYATLENSREMLRAHMKKLDVDMPRAVVLPVYQKDFDGERSKYAIKKAKEVHEKFGAPWIVKSFTPDANMGIHLAKTFDELVGAIEDGAKHEKSILVEEFIAGKVASIHSVPEFRNDLPAQAGKIYVFPLGNTFGNFSAEEKEKLSNLVKDLHIHLGVKHYLKSDFVMNSHGKIYLLYIDAMPDLKPDSHFSQVCESVGTSVYQVVEHILEQV